MSDHKILVWAHRGYSGKAPENTLDSFRKAAEAGADGVELDVQLTKDGEVVVIHDETVDRTTDGTGWVKDYSFDDLRKLNASFQNDLRGGKVVRPDRLFPEYSSEQIPTMEEVFDLLKPTGLTINIELKTGIIFYPGLEEKIVGLTKKWGMEDRVIYSSFNHASVMKIRALDPEAETGFLYGDGPLGMASYGKEHGVNALHPALYNLQYPGFLEECAKAGLDLNVWTVNEPRYVDLCKKAHVHAVITNEPEMAEKVLRG